MKSLGSYALLQVLGVDLKDRIPERLKLLKIAIFGSNLRMKVISTSFHPRRHNLDASRLRREFASSPVVL
jgi:hypothetical protein